MTATAHGFTRDKRQTRAGGRYDSRHRKARANAARRHRVDDPCTRCGVPLGPMGPHLHYDHNAAGTGYLGFAHARCNIRAGSAEGNRRQGGAPKWVAAQQQVRRRSRAW